MIADNIGRRPALIASWGSCTVGCLMMAAAWFKDGFWLMFFGYLIAGFGVNPAITLHYSFLNEHSRNNRFKILRIFISKLYAYISEIGIIFLFYQKISESINHIPEFR